MIIGKLLGSFFGYKILNIPGLLIGLWLGHKFDQGLSNLSKKSANPRQIQNTFFEASFAVMGHISKADGVVSQAEIDATEQIIRRLELNHEKRNQAIRAFGRGKMADFDLHQEINALLQHALRSPNLLRLFIEFQLLVATAEGKPSAPAMQILYTIAQRLGIPGIVLERMVEQVIAQRYFHGAQNQTHKPTLTQAYQVLGIAKDSGINEVKRAYRKLMAQHHPDKLLAKGMPEEMVKLATEKSQEIQAAYDLIKKQTSSF